MGDILAVAVAVLTPTLGAPIVISGVSVYWLPAFIIVIEETDSPSKVAKAVAVSPLGPEGASIVTLGVEVYPVPPEPTVIVFIDSNKVLK